MVMFQEKSILLIALVIISSTDLPYITCPETSTSTSVVDEQKAAQQCLIKSSPFKVDVTILTTQKFIAMICTQNRTRKIEYQFKLYKKSAGGQFSKYMENCLRPLQPSAFQHFSDLGKKYMKAKEFMETESLKQTQFATFDENEFERLLRERGVQKEAQVFVENSSKESSQEVDVSEIDSENAFNLSTDVSAVNEYSIFAEGLCYSWFITNPEKEPKLFSKIEKNFIERMPKETTLQDVARIVHPQADIFAMVSRLTGTKTSQQLIALGEKWLEIYREEYQQIDQIYYKDKNEDRIAALDSKLTGGMNLYKSCSRKTCAMETSDENYVPFYEWIKNEVRKKNLEHDLLRVLLNDDPDIQNQIRTDRAGGQTD